MRIDVWSDVICPWCYIGKRRLEQALGGRDDVEVVWHSFMLDPGLPKESTESMAAHLGRKYGGGEAAGRQMIDRTEAVAAEEGLLFRLHQAQAGNTFDAHRLLHLALTEGGPELQGTLKEHLLDAYFVRTQNPADHDVLRAAAAGVGLDADRVEQVLAGDEFGDEVYADIEKAHQLGVQGVPFYVLDDRLGVSGAQPVEVFRSALAQAGLSPLAMVTGDGDAACGPDGCEIPASR